jgi:hypothetical protein
VAENPWSELRCSDRDSEAGKDPRSGSGDHFAVFNQPSRMPNLLNAERFVELIRKIVQFLLAVYLPFALPCMYLHCLNRGPLLCMLLKLRLRADSIPSALTIFSIT